MRKWRAAGASDEISTPGRSRWGWDVRSLANAQVGRSGKILVSLRKGAHAARRVGWAVILSRADGEGSATSQAISSCILVIADPSLPAHRPRRSG